MELVKKIIKVGNSAGVLLPREWYGGEARVELINKPLNIKQDILEILDCYMPSILGIYLVGSYARNEQTEDSDVDVLVITNNINKRIKKGRYDILLISEKEINKQLKENILPILPMIKEAKTIINNKLLELFLNYPLTKENLKWHIDTTKSAINVIKADLKISKELNEKINDASAYSLILRLRTLYIIDCLRKNKIWKKKEFLELVKKISGSLIAYERYIESKKNNSKASKLPIDETEKLIDYIDKKIIGLEKWLREKKD